MLYSDREQKADTTPKARPRTVPKFTFQRPVVLGSRGLGVRSFTITFHPIYIRFLLHCFARASLVSDTVLKVKRKNTIFWWLHNQGNRLNRRLGPIRIKRLARFEHPVDQVYQLVHSRRNTGATGSQGPRGQVLQ